MGFFEDKLKKIKSSKEESNNPYTGEGIRNKANDDRYMNLAKSKRNWQIATFICLGVIAMQEYFIDGMASKSHVEPFVVELNNGQPVNTIRATELAPDERLKLITILLRKYIQDARTVSNDKATEDKIMDTVYARTADPATNFLNEYYKENNPYINANTYTVIPNIIDSLQTSDDTWQITWEETKRSVTDATIISKERYVAQLTIKKTTPDSENANLNPFGIYVTKLSWARSQ